MVAKASSKYRYNDAKVFSYYRRSRQLARLANQVAVWLAMVGVFGFEGIWLEVGAGEGELFSLLDEKMQSQMFLTDLNPVFVDRIQSRFPNVLSEVADATCLPYEDHSFTGIVSLSMLDTLRQEDLDKALQEMARVSQGPIVHFLDLYPDPDITAAEHPADFLVPMAQDKYGRRSISSYCALPKYMAQTFLNTLPEASLVSRFFEGEGSIHRLHLAPDFPSIAQWYLSEFSGRIAAFASRKIFPVNSFEQRLKTAAQKADLSIEVKMINGRVVVPFTGFSVMLHELGEFFVGPKVNDLYPSVRAGKTLLASNLHMATLRHKLAAY